MKVEISISSRDRKAEMAAWEQWIADFNDELKKASKTMKISGNKFSVRRSEYDYSDSPSLDELTFDMAGVEFTVAFIDNYAGNKPAVVVQISSKAKPGVIEKKVSGKNTSPKVILKKLDGFFKTGGKW